MVVYKGRLFFSHLFSCYSLFRPYSLRKKKKVSWLKVGCIWCSVALDFLSDSAFHRPLVMHTYRGPEFQMPGTMCCVWRNPFLCPPLKAWWEAGPTVESGGPSAGCGVCGHQPHPAHCCVQFSWCSYSSLGLGKRQTDKVYRCRTW